MKRRCGAKIPWIYGGAIGATGQAMTILPDQPPCLRCLIPESPPPGSMPTCDTAGILASAIHAIAAIQCCEAIKILSGNLDVVSRGLTVVDLWDNRFRQVGLSRLAEQGCPTCRGEDFPCLAGRRGSQSAVLCGRNAVQLAAPSDGGTSNSFRSTRWSRNSAASAESRVTRISCVSRSTALRSRSSPTAAPSSPAPTTLRRPAACMRNISGCKSHADGSVTNRPAISQSGPIGRR